MKRFAQFILKYKVLHYVFWGYSFLAQWHLMSQIRNTEEYHFLNPIDTFFNIVITAMCAYTCLWWLFPAYFIKKRYILFFLYIVGLAIFYTLLGVVIQATYVPLLLDGTIPSTSMELMVSITAHFTDVLVNTLLILIVHAAYYYFNLENKKQTAAQLKLKSELNQLKSQFSPEFMLDALNGIDLELKINPERASKLLQQFSGLMRYTLQNSSLDGIKLSDEIAVIEYYLSIRKLIHQDTIVVTSIFENGTPDYEIPPNLLLPLVDQAFKSCSSSPLQENQITISLTSNKKHLVLDITNTVCSESHLLLPIQMESLNQIKHRFAVLFPNRYMFEFHSTTSFHGVKVQLDWPTNQIS